MNTFNLKKETDGGDHVKMEIFVNEESGEKQDGGFGAIVKTEPHDTELFALCYNSSEGYSSTSHYQPSNSYYENLPNFRSQFNFKGPVSPVCETKLPQFPVTITGMYSADILREKLVLRKQQISKPSTASSTGTSEHMNTVAHEHWSPQDISKIKAEPFEHWQEPNVDETQVYVETSSHSYTNQHQGDVNRSANTCSQKAFSNQGVLHEPGVQSAAEAENMFELSPLTSVIKTEPFLYNDIYAYNSFGVENGKRETESKICEVKQSLSNEPGENSITVKERQLEGSPDDREKGVSSSGDGLTDGKLQCFLNTADDKKSNSGHLNELTSKTRNSYDKGIRKKGQKRNFCEICKKSFSVSASLKRHMLGHTGERPFRCELCEKTFSDRGLLKMHMVTHTGEKAFACEICFKKFSLSCNLKTHMLTHTGERPFSCEICQQKFRYGNALKTHMRRHTGERPYSCHICLDRFFVSTALKKHIRIHTGEKPYPCEICDRRCADSSSLVKHMRTHTGERPFSCDICQKKFAASSTLKKHRLIHTGEKPHSCEICQRMFTESSSLRKHMLTHTGEKPYSCDICQKKFSQPGSVKIHKRIHTGEKPFCCEICNKRFLRASGLRLHSVVHTGERPFSCEICEKTFPYAVSLKLHMVTHTGKKAFTCDICEKVFSHASNLQRHKLAHLTEAFCV